jgi:hypothetical protein
MFMPAVPVSMWRHAGWHAQTDKWEIFPRQLKIGEVDLFPTENS